MSEPRNLSVPGPHGPIPVRAYEPETIERALLWAHGGAFIGGDLDMPESDWVARQLAERASALVVAVDYRLAGAEVHYPVPADDVLAAWEWLQREVTARRPQVPIALGGASAGGNLAASAALRADAARRPAALLLAYPTLHAVQRPSHASVTNADWPAAAIEAMYLDYLGTPLAVAEVFAVPGTAGTAELSVLPPTTIIASDNDCLRASAEQFTEQLEAAGVEVSYHLEPGTHHGHLNDQNDPGADPSIAVFTRALLAAR